MANIIIDLTAYIIKTEDIDHRSDHLTGRLSNHQIGRLSNHQTAYTVKHQALHLTDGRGDTAT